MTKKIIVVIAAILMIAGSAFAAMQIMEIGPFAPEPQAAEAEKTGHDSDSDTPAVPRFIELDPMVIPVIEGDRVAATVQIQLQLEISPQNESEVRRLLPRLGDAFIRDLNGYLPRLMRREGFLDVDRIKQRLVIVAEKAIGPGLVDNVLVQSVSDRPN